MSSTVLCRVRGALNSARLRLQLAQLLLRDSRALLHFVQAGGVPTVFTQTIFDSELFQQTLEPPQRNVFPV